MVFATIILVDSWQLFLDLVEERRDGLSSPMGKWISPSTVFRISGAR